MKKIVSVAMLFVFSFAIISCDKAPFISDKVVRGDYEIWAYGSYYSYLKGRATKFMETNPEIKINIKEVDANKYKNDFISAIDNNNDVPSAVLFKGSDMSDIIQHKENSFKDITLKIESIKKRFTQSRLEDVTINGAVYGIPLDCKPLVLLADKAKLNKYGFTLLDLNTWQDTINTGSEIFKKSKGQDCLFKITKDQEIDILNILVKQLKQSDESFDIDNEKNSSLIKAGAIIDELKDKNILKIVAKEYTGVASIVSYKEAIELNEKPPSEGYIVTNIPTTESGGDKFITLEGTNMLLTYKEQDVDGLIEFIKYITNDENSILEMKNNDIYTSNQEVYNKKAFDNTFDGLGKDKLLARMANIILKEEDIKDINKITNFIKKNKKQILKNEYSALL